MTITNKSRCKINLLLNILGKRKDGFHELETLMQPVPLYDEITYSVVGSTIKLTTNRPDLPCGRSNLVVRAAEKFRQTAEIADGLKIHLEKKIPMEAGMGGGSSNAAVTLLSLNELFGHPLSSSQLAKIACELGSDVPFFLQNNPALATGRGELIEVMEAFECMKKLSLVLFHPGFGISTAWSYKTLAEYPRALKGRPGRAKSLIKAMQSNDPNWGALLYNSLERPAFQKYPVLELYVNEFKKLGAVASLMSGSGSTVFGYFSSTDAASNALKNFRAKFGLAGWSTIVLSQAEG